MEERSVVRRKRSINRTNLETFFFFYYYYVAQRVGGECCAAGTGAGTGAATPAIGATTTPAGDFFLFFL